MAAGDATASIPAAQEIHFTLGVGCETFPAAGMPAGRKPMTSDTDQHAEDFGRDAHQAEGWPIRPLMLALVGLAAGLGFHLIVGTDYSATPSVMQSTALTALLVGAFMFGLTVERRHLVPALIFALVTAVAAAGIMWWNGSPDHWGGGDGWRLFSLAIALAIAAPLFQSARDAGGFSFDYQSVHDHVWTNIVLWFACWAFVLIVWLLGVLLSSLFQLIDLNFLHELMRKDWFTRCLIGLAFGAGLGVLREQDTIVRMLQRVVTVVLSVLAPVLAVGLVVFLLALPFTGLDPLWKSRSATTILLLCAAGAAVLANAVIGNAPDQARRAIALRYAGIALAAVILPLAVIAAVAVGLRIDQYGYTPERLWGLTFVVIASAFGVAYLVALVRGRLDWAERVRPSNLILAIGLCGVAIVLATPLVSFNAISVRDQVARLESGKLTPDTFDWRALAFDFGEAGRGALKRLEASANPAIRAKAVEVAKVKNKWEIDAPDRAEEKKATLARNLRVLPAGTALTPELRDAVLEKMNCQFTPCTLVIQPGGEEAVLLENSCFAKPNANSQATAPRALPYLDSGRCSVSGRLVRTDGKWSNPAEAALNDADRKAQADGFAAGRVEVRPVTRRQVFVGGVPVGDAFE
jgi:hypothetical protein